MTAQNLPYDVKKTKPTEPPLILIVDDEEAIAEVLAAIVEEWGYTPLVAYNGHQALMLAREHWPALVLTDLMMPVLDGAGLINALHAEAASQHRDVPPIVLLTAGGGKAVNHLPADAFVFKPFDLAQLESVIHRLLEQKA